MRIPKKPPKFDRLAFLSDPQTHVNMMRPEVMEAVEKANDEYLHWDKVSYRPTPTGIAKEHFWWLMKLLRQSKVTIPLSYWRKGQHLYCAMPPKHQEWLHRIDTQAGGTIGAFQESTFDDESGRYLFNSLMEEAIASSQLEGASTTRRIAKEMLRANRTPKNEAERMILNNYQTMLEVRDLKDEKLTPGLLCELQHAIVKDTTSNSDEAGRFRRSNELIQVVDNTKNEVIHDPPDASELEWRIQEICDFANHDSDPFVHPAIKAIVLHFALGFVHPFVDGNGRTARAIFYWYMLKNDYWLLEYFPISRVIIRAPARYARAYLYTESDDGDLTYFLRFNLESILTAMKDFQSYLANEMRDQTKAKRLLEDYPGLNHRQRTLLNDALKNPAISCKIQEYAGKHRVTYPTAHSDLMELKTLGLFVTSKDGKTLLFRPVDGIRKKLNWRPSLRIANDKIREPVAITRNAERPQPN